MKKKLTVFFLVIIYTNSCSAQKIYKFSDTFYLKGNIKSENISFLILDYKDKNDILISDTAFIKNGEFYFTGLIREPTIASLKDNSKMTGNFTTLFLEPSIVKVNLTENNFEKAEISGSLTQNESRLLKEQKLSVYKAYNFLENEYAQLNEKNKSITDFYSKEQTTNKIENIKNQLENYSRALKEFDYFFIFKHPSSYLSSYLLRSYFSELPIDSVKMFYKNFDLTIKNSRYGKMVALEISKKQLSSLGKKAPDFKTNDFNGENISLSSFEGNSYVLLDFWASWCIPCRKSNPHLRHLYSEYHAKGFDIIGISIDNNKSEWSEAIIMDSIDIWHHILLTKDLENQTENDISTKYEIPSIPVQILIDKEGIIVAKWYGQSKENETDLEKTLSKIFE